MTDKKKIDEAVTLTMNGGVDDQGVTVASTVTANDMVELAMILKRAGITSAMYEGPASISDDNSDGISTTINAPNLRAIMSMMEPVFQAAGDLESGVDDMAHDAEVPAEEPCVDGACDAPVDEPVVDVAPEVDMGDDLEEPVSEMSLDENADDDQFDALQAIIDYHVAAGEADGVMEADIGDRLANIFWVAVPYNEDNYDYTPQLANTLKGMAKASYPKFRVFDKGIYNDDEAMLGMAFLTIRPSAVKEEADYDYRTHNVHPQEYAGKSSKTPIQPDTKQVPARSGDNPIKGFKDYFREATDRNFVAPVVETPVTGDTLLDEFHLNELSNDLKSRYMRKAADNINIVGRHAMDMRAIGNDEQADKNQAYIDKRARGMFRAIAKEAELDEAGRADWQQKARQYGEPYYLNTDCGYASLDSIMRAEGFFSDMEMGLAQHATKVGFTVLEIDRNGKKGYNFVNSPDSRLQPGTPVTCVTQTGNGDKFRPGKFIASFTAKDLSMNLDQVKAELAKYGITPSKKLPVKTFD